MKQRSRTAHDKLFAAIVLGDTRGEVGFSATKLERTRRRSAPGGMCLWRWRALSCLTATHILACGSNSQTQTPSWSNPPGSTTGSGGTNAGSAGTKSDASSPLGMSGSGVSPGGSSGTSNPTDGGGGTGTAKGQASGVPDAGVMMPSDSGLETSNGGSGPSGDSGVACNPADKTADPTPVSMSMIMGYSQFTTPPTTGPYMPVIETDPGLPQWTVYRPNPLTANMLYPVLVWAEGGCLQDGTLYGQWLLEAASWGFIALADGVPTDPSADPGSNGIRSGAQGQPQAMTMDWIIAENGRPCSQYYQKVAVDKIAVSGQSCGGIMSLYAAGDKRVTTAIINNSGLFSADQTAYSALHTPIAYFIGGSSDIAYSNSESDYMNINNVPIFDGNDDVGHGATWGEVNGGEFGRVNLGWLKWQLMGDMTAANMFVGSNCELCTSTVWTVKKKNIP